MGKTKDKDTPNQIRTALLKVRYAMRMRRDGIGRPTKSEAAEEQQASNVRLPDVAIYLRLLRDGFIDRNPYTLTTKGWTIVPRSP